MYVGSSCQVTFDDYDGLRVHRLWAEAHRTCEVCDEVFDNANNLESHMIIHKEPDIKCVFCTRMFRSGSSMLIHLETGCHESHWNTAYTQDALMVFTKYHPTDYGINCNRTGPIICGCKGKDFSKVSALCQHLESDACDISHRGSDVVDELIDMMRDGIWQYSRRGNVKDISFENVIVKWGA